MALSKLAANSFDLTDNYAFTGTTTGVTSTQKLFLIKNLDASSSGTLSFVDGSDSVDLDNTYKTYYFKFINMHPASDNVEFQWNGSTDTGSNYNVTITTSVIQYYHDEAGSATALQYDTGMDLAQSTNPQIIAENIGNGSDECASGYLHLFNPSSTTFVKNFLISSASYFASDYSNNYYVAGYGNTTSAVDAIQFTMSSGNIDSGTIKLYGVS